MKAKVMLGISVAAMLKDCPEGMPLYSPLCGPCKLVNVDYDGTPNDRLIIQVEDHKKNRLFFTDEGKYMNSGDVVLFPNKNCKPTDWELFAMGRLQDGDGDCVERREHKGKVIERTGKFVKLATTFVKYPVDDKWFRAGRYVIVNADRIESIELRRRCDFDDDDVVTFNSGEKYALDRQSSEMLQQMLLGEQND